MCFLSLAVWPYCKWWEAGWGSGNENTSWDSVCSVEFSSLNQKRSQLETVSQISSQSEAVVAHRGHVATSDFPQSCTSVCCSYSPIKSKYVLFVYFLIFSVNIQYGVYAPSQHELPRSPCRSVSYVLPGAPPTSCEFHYCAGTIRGRG